MAEPEFLRRMKAAASPDIPQAVHQSGAPDVPMQAPRPAFLERMKRLAAESELGAVPTAVREELRRSQTHSTPAPGAPPGRVPSRDPNVMGQPQEVPATIADKATRMQLARDLGLATRIGLETAGSAAGAPGAATALTQIGRRFAVPGLVRLGENRAVQALGRAVGTGAGSLIAEPFDPSADPFGSAARAAAFSGVADSLAAGYYGAKDAILSAPLTPGARSTRRLLGEEASPSAGRLTTSRAVDTAENVSEYAFLGGRVEARNLRASERAKRLVYDLTNRYLKGASRQEVDNLVSDVLTRGDEAFRATAERLYSKVDELAGVEIPTRDLIKLRNDIVTEFQAGARDDGMIELVYAIDRTLGVPRPMRGIDKGVMVSSEVGPKRFDPRKPGAIVTEGADTEAQRLGEFPRFEMDNITGEMRPALPDTGAGRFTRGPGGGWVDTPPTARGTITFAEAQKLRSDMLRAARARGNSNFPGQLEGTAKRVSGQLDKDIEALGTSLAGSSLDAYQYFRLANQFWKDGAEAFSSEAMKAIANARPDDLFKMLMREDSPQQVALFRKITLGGVGTGEDTAVQIRKSAQRTLRDPAASQIAKDIAQSRLDGLAAGQEAWEKFQGQFLLRVLEGSDEAYGLATEAARGTRTLVGSQAIDRLRAYGEPMLREIFPTQGGRRQFERFLRAVEMPQLGTGFGAGRIAIQLQQAAAVGGLALTLWSGSPEGALGGAAILLAPAALGRLVTSDRFINALFRARKARLGTEAHRRAWIQVATIASAEGARVIRSDGSIVDPQGDTAVRNRFRATADAAGYGR